MCIRDSDERYYDSIYYYSLAINHEYSLLSQNSNHNDDEETINHNIYDNLEYINNQLSTKDKLSKLFSNRSSAFLLCNQPYRSLDDALTCIELNPKWFKGYYRGSKAYYELGKLDDARLLIEKALLLKPDEDRSVVDQPDEDTLLKLYEEVKNDNIKDRKGIGQCYSWYYY